MIRNLRCLYIKRDLSSLVDPIGPPSLEDTIKTYIATGRMDVASAEDAAFDFLDGKSNIDADVTPNDLDIFEVASAKVEPLPPVVTSVTPNSDVNPNSDVTSTPDVQDAK